MPPAWPALCTLLALALLLVLVIRLQWHAFLALMVVSLLLGLGGGLTPPQVVDVFTRGVGDILKDVAILLALGAILGRLLESSGAATVIAQTLINAFGLARAPLAILLAGFLIGIPVLFNVGFLLLIPIIWRLQKQTGHSLLYFLLPLAFSLATTHSLVPPHPGIIGAVNMLGGPDTSSTMVQTILFGSLMSLPIILIGWFGPGLLWARRQFVTAPEQFSLPGATGPDDAPPPSFAICVLIVTMPLLLSLISFGATLLADMDSLPAWLTEPPWEEDDWFVPAPLAWFAFIGKPVIALLAPTLLALWYLGARRGLSASKLSRLAEDSLRDVGSMVFLFGAAGGFKEVILTTGAGKIIGEAILSVPFLPPLAAAYLVAVLMRIALGSATASIFTASSLLAGLVPSFAGRETLLVLAVANGVTFMTQPADSGFWMIKEYGNLSVRDVMLKFNGCRMAMSVSGLILLLMVDWLF